MRNTPVTDDVERHTGSEYAAPDVQPAQQDPYRPLDWGLQIACQLATNAAEWPHHSDPWIEDAAQTIFAAQNGADEWQPTPRRVHIRDAIQLRDSNSLVKAVLEARLLSQQTPIQISRRCRFDEEMIATYGALLFDVEGPHRVGVALMSPSPVRVKKANQPYRVGEFLKSPMLLRSPAGLERMIETICWLDGPTLADGLSESDGVHLVAELTSRLLLAAALLPRRRAIHEECGRCERSLANDMSCNRLSGNTLDGILALLHELRVTAALHKQIERLRENERKSAESAGPGDPVIGADGAVVV